MTSPTTAREALIAEAIGDFAGLLDRAEALLTALDDARNALLQEGTALRDQLLGFERRIAVVTENAKTQTVRHLAARADEATRRCIDVQSRAMADAARVAFGAEIGATMQRLQTTLHALTKPRVLLWERFLTHAAAAAVGWASAWALALYAGPR